MEKPVPPLEAPLTAEFVNARFWPSRHEARQRARRRLRPVEVALLGRYREELSGDVLELGSCGGQLTEALVYHARSLIGVGLSGPTVEVCRQRHPTATFVDCNLLDVDAFECGQFSAIVAGQFVLDLLGDGQRRWLLQRLSRILDDDGVLIFSSHNLACESLVTSPVRNLARHPLAPWRLPRALGNRAHLGCLQQREHGYAVLNDHAHDYGLLSYYISRDGQERQLSEHDFCLLECVTIDDEPVERGDGAYGRRELHYAAQPSI